MDGLRILIVEDSPTDVEILQRHLKRLADLNPTVIHASYGHDGLRSVRVAEVDLVFLDIQLPDMTGLEFLDQLQDMVKKPAVIVLTGSADETTAVSAMKAGALDFLNKNKLNASMLERTIKNALERHQLQTALLSTQAQLSTMIQEAPVGMALLDPELHFLHVNSTLAELAGRRAEEMQGKHCRDIQSPLIQQLEWMCQRVLFSGKSYRDLEINSMQGTDSKHWLCSVYPVKTQAGHVQWVGITVTDITRSKQTSILLQQSQSRLNMTLEATRVGTWEWDSRTRKISWFGQTDRILGFRGNSGDTSMDHFLSQVHGEDLPRVKEQLKAAIREGEPFELEMRVLRQEGTVRWIMSRGRVEHGANHTVISGALIDITDLKEAELALREISQVQQRFVNDAAHELRAPLTAIQGNLDLIHRYSNMPDEDKEEALADVAREATRLSRLVQDMLALAKGDSGALIRRDPLDLEEVIADAVQAVSFQLQNHQVTIQLEGITVMGDYDRLKQVMVILLENAAKYTPTGGTVAVGARIHKEHACIWVQDSGMGIREEDLPRVFERFYRGQFSREADPGGTGLGLPIAKWIVEAHEGTIHLTSLPGQGTTVSIELPLLDPEEDPVPSGEISR